jgi:hypothetical protein
MHPSFNFIDKKNVYIYKEISKIQASVFFYVLLNPDQNLNSFNFFFFFWNIFLIV